MYPDTDSPPQAITRDRVERLLDGLPEAPWDREKRYREAGLPTHVIHYLIRRGGARLVDHVVEKSGIDLRTAGFFFGERLKGLRRRGVRVDEVTKAQWAGWFQLVAEHPVLREVNDRACRWMADHSGMCPRMWVEENGYAVAPDDWQATARATANSAILDFPNGTPGQALRRRMGAVMEELRGVVSARAVEEHLVEGDAI